MNDPANGSAMPATRASPARHAADVQDAGTVPAQGRSADSGAVQPGLVGPNPVGTGARLSTARVAQGLSLGDVARQLKLSVRQVEALERDDYDVFPSRVFVRGFLRNYTKLLRIDLDSQIAQLETEEIPASGVHEAGEADAEQARGARRVRRIRWLLLALAVALIAFALLRPASDGGAGSRDGAAAQADAIRLSEPPPMADGTGVTRADSK